MTWQNVGGFSSSADWAYSQTLTSNLIRLTSTFTFSSSEKTFPYNTYALISLVLEQQGKLYHLVPKVIYPDPATRILDLGQIGLSDPQRLGVKIVVGTRSLSSVQWTILAEQWTGAITPVITSIAEETQQEIVTETLAGVETLISDNSQPQPIDPLIIPPL